MWLMGYVLLKMFSVRGLILCVSDLSLLSLFFFLKERLTLVKKIKEKNIFCILSIFFAT